MSAISQRSTVVGVFQDPQEADRAVAALMKAGFRQDQIGIALRRGEGMTGATAEGGDEAEGTHAESGAIAGVLTGLGLGTLAGLGVLAGVIPVIGPAITAGTLGIVLSNAAVGAGIAGLAGALMGAGVPEHEAQYYHQEFEAGRTIVTVKAETRADEASAILRQHGAYDMSTRGTSATAATTTASAATRAAAGAGAATLGGVTATGHGTVAGRAGDTIEVKEERLHAEKRPVETGEVTVRKEVHTENRTIEVPVQREEVVIERTPVHGRAATEGITGDAIRAGEEVRIPVREEQVNVTKEAVVNEEVRVGKRTVQDTERVSGQVRKEEVKVEQTGDVDVKTRGTGKP
jgi:uncharacterized protein (TIGR02271 family)